MLKKFEKNGISIEINTLGAELKSLVSGDVNYIWCSNPKFWDRSAPVLFPVVGKLKGLQTQIEDKIYHIPQHGFLRDLEFELFEEKDNTITFVNKYNDETLKMYPYKYQAFIRYTINLTELKTEFIIKNIKLIRIIYKVYIIYQF